MIALIQRVTMARVQVAGRTVGEIGAGLAALIGVERNDGQAQAQRLLERMLDYRVFADAAGRMNRSLRDTAGGLLLVPQFTLLADTSSGSRPGFSRAAEPAQARALFEQLLGAAQAAHAPVAAGEFGAHMELTLTNDGPVTFWLAVPPAPAATEA
jgi:D-tyrosyl-tRNA(Tyr) deacylase